ncbi:MAG TPA: FecR family protein [Treponemataceae bacterium]|nr:FecR family protein [Treponemataceae bacterium]
MVCKKTLLILLVGILSLPIVAKDATFKSVSGKVEYRTVANEDWQSATVGTVIPEGSDISTGFKSNAALLLNGSLVMVKPLTRMSLDQIAKTSTETTTGLHLMSGKVQVEVRPSVSTEKTEFKIKSPMTTASVRGTGFICNISDILVTHGNVEMRNNYGVRRNVFGGQFTSVGPSASIVKAIPVALAQTPLFDDLDMTDDRLNDAINELANTPLGDASSQILNDSIRKFSDMLKSTDSAQKEKTPPTKLPTAEFKTTVQISVQ